jgi:hypothetical protein
MGKFCILQLKRGPTAALLNLKLGTVKGDRHPLQNYDLHVRMRPNSKSYGGGRIVSDQPTD